MEKIQAIKHDKQYDAEQIWFAIEIRPVSRNVDSFNGRYAGTPAGELWGKTNEKILGEEVR